MLKSQIKEILKSPKNRATISKAVRHEHRLRFHIDTNMEANNVRLVVNDFLNYVKGLLPKDKYQIFLQLFCFPIATNELTEEILSALEKVYDGKDAYEEYNFISPQELDDWNSYRSEVINAYSFWRGTAFEKMKTCINGFIIVDLKEEQETEKPEPYFYFTPISDIKDFECKTNGDVDWILIEQENSRLAVFDDESYRVFELNDKKEIVGEAIIENTHDLGYCPASFFWNDKLTEDNKALKKSPLSNQLANLDWLLFFLTSKKHLDLYAPYPIYSGYQQDCEFENKNNGDYCDAGFIKNKVGEYYVDRSGTLNKCPVCADSRLAGVGSFVEVPLPNRDNDFKDLRNPVQITSIDVNSLKYNVDEVQRLNDKIYAAVVGSGGDMKMDKAFNKDQVKANTESRRNVLLSLKKNFEKIQSWTEDTVCRLRYGATYLSNTIFYGSDWYLYDVDQLTEQYKLAKEAGATDYQLDLIQDQIIETENKNNPMALQRAEILKNLEPYRHQTRAEVLEMMEKGFGDKDLIAVKLNFATFVLRFERENTDIVEFGSALSFSNKINIILNTFKDYGRTEQINGGASGSE